MKIRSKKSTLSQHQLKTIGYQNQSQIPYYLWNQSLGQLFKSYNSLRKGKSKQYNSDFKQFMSMKTDGPDQQGTGRYKFKDIQHIYFTVIKKQNKMYQNSKNIIKKQKNQKKNNYNLNVNEKEKLFQNNQKTNQYIFVNDNIDAQNIHINDKSQTGQFQDSLQFIQIMLSSFFQIPTSYHDFGLYIDNKRNKIIDRNEQIQFDVKTDTSNQMFQVLSLFDLGQQYQQKICKIKNKKRTILLFLIQVNLIQEQDYNQIDGRAQGNGIAFVTFQKEDFQVKSIKQLGKFQFPSYTLSILIHQCLHTLGFDHCAAWSCLMNSVTNQQFWLCPSCLRKLQSQLKDKNISIIDWYKDIVKNLQYIKNKFQKKYGSHNMLRLADSIILNANKSNEFQSMLQKGQKIINKLKVNQIK